MGGNYIFKVIWKSNAIFIFVFQHLCSEAFEIDSTSWCLKSLMQTVITSEPQCFVVTCFLIYIRFLCKHFLLEEKQQSLQSPQVGCNGKSCPARLILRPELMTAIRRSVGRDQLSMTLIKFFVSSCECQEAKMIFSEDREEKAILAVLKVDGAEQLKMVDHHRQYKCYSFPKVIHMLYLYNAPLTTSSLNQWRLGSCIRVWIALSVKNLHDWVC